MTRFLVVPQWQGSAAARAMLLIDGATAIAEDLPRARTSTLDVPLEAGDAEGTRVQRLSSLRRVRELIEAVPATEEPTVMIGGDCSVSVGGIAALPGDLDDVALVWCAAHPDLHTPSDSPSGAYAGMALRAALGDPANPLPGRPGLRPERVVLAGAREIAEDEQAYLAAAPIVRIDDLRDGGALTEAATATGAARVYVHIDVDVLDPSAIEGVSEPVPFGLDPAVLTAALRELREHLPIAGATIAGYAPRSPADAVADLGTILRLIGAVA